MAGLMMVVGLAVAGEIGLIIMAVIALGINLYSYYNSHSMVPKMMGGQLVTAQEAPDLYRIVEQAACQAKMPFKPELLSQFTIEHLEARCTGHCRPGDCPRHIPSVYVIDTPIPNAFATGTASEALGRGGDDRDHGSADAAGTGRRDGARAGPRHQPRHPVVDDRGVNGDGDLVHRHAGSVVAVHGLPVRRHGRPRWRRRRRRPPRRRADRSNPGAVHCDDDPDGGQPTAGTQGRRHRLTSLRRPGGSWPTP